MSNEITYCMYESHLICNPKMCSLLKCPRVQKSLGYSLDRLYELGVKERPRSDLQNSMFI